MLHKSLHISTLYPEFWHSFQRILFPPVTFALGFSMWLSGCLACHTYLLPCSQSWALLEEPPIVWPLKNFPSFYGTRRFNTVLTRALHWSLSWAISIHSIPSYLSKIHFNIVHPPTSWPSPWSLSFWLSHQYPICIPLLPPSCYMPCPSPWPSSGSRLFTETIALH
jgi:hypothetical protein